MSDEKPFAPTEKRKRQAWDSGDIAKSREITAVSLVLGGSVGSVILLSFLGESLRQYFTIAFGETQDFHTNTMILSGCDLLVRAGVYLLFWIGLPIFCVLLSESSQSRFRGVKCNNLLRWKRLNVAEGVKRVYQKQSLLDALRSLVVWGIGVFLVLLTLFPLLSWNGGSGVDLEHDLPLACEFILKRLWMRLLGLGVFVAALDFLIVTHSWKKRNSMKREELREEMKESEGNPEVRSLRRQLHLEMLAHGEIQAVRRARVVLVQTKQGV